VTVNKVGLNRTPLGAHKSPVQVSSPLDRRHAGDSRATAPHHIIGYLIGVRNEKWGRRKCRGISVTLAACEGDLRRGEALHHTIVEAERYPHDKIH
jgi:hypothetical protein